MVKFSMSPVSDASKVRSTVSRISSELLSMATTSPG